MDADLGGANLHTCLGMEQVEGGLGDFIEHRVAKLEDVLLPTGVPNLSLVSGASDQLDIANPKHQQKLRLLRSVQNLDADYAILDIGSGTSFNVLDFFLVADHGILTLIPEPTSVENAYRFLKAAFYRRLKAVEKVYGIERHPGVGSAVGVGRLAGPAGAAAGGAGARCGPGRGARARDGQVPAAAGGEHGAHGRGSRGRRGGGGGLAASYFGLEMDYLGCIGYDDEVWRSVRAKQPLLLQYPTGETATAIGGIVDRLLRLEQPPLAAVGEKP